MTTEYLYEFLVLTSTMNFSRAAEKLFITQTTLSRHIKVLEEELGFKLFERNTHTVTLTTKGRLFAQEAANIHSSYSKILRSMDKSDTLGKKHIRIAVASTSFSKSLKSFLRKFEQNHQQYSLDIDLLPDMGLDQFAADHHILFSPFEYHSPAGMSRLSYTLYESASLARSIRNSGSPVSDSLEQFGNRILLVPYASELFCSYSYIKQYVDRLLGGKLRSRPVSNVDTALLLVQQNRGFAIVPGHIASQSYHDILFSGINDDNCRFTTFLYAKESLDFEFQQLFFHEIEHQLLKETHSS